MLLAVIGIVTWSDSSGKINI